MYAQPNYPYDKHSVWNRNQLGALPGGIGEYAVMGLIAYFAWKMYKGKKIF